MNRRRIERHQIDAAASADAFIGRHVDAPSQERRFVGFGVARMENGRLAVRQAETETPRNGVGRGIDVDRQIADANRIARFDAFHFGPFFGRDFAIDQALSQRVQRIARSVHGRQFRSRQQVFENSRRVIRMAMRQKNGGRRIRGLFQPFDRQTVVQSGNDLFISAVRENIGKVMVGSEAVSDSPVCLFSVTEANVWQLAQISRALLPPRGVQYKPF